jgi:CHRD domain
MRGWRVVVKRSLWAGVGATAILVAGCAHSGGTGSSALVGQQPLTGGQEVPPVTTNASGVTDIYVHAFKCPPATSGSNCYNVIGNVSVAGIIPTAVHVHQAAPGQNGPVIVPLIRLSDTVWTVPSGATINQAQYEAWWAGNTYVNVHSTANPGGEIRGQLRH